MFTSVLLLAVGGMLLVVAWCPIRAVAWQFIRLIAGINVVICTAVVIWAVRHHAWPSDAWTLATTASVVFAGFGAAGMMVLAPLLPSAKTWTAGGVRGIAICAGLMALAGGFMWGVPPLPASWWFRACADVLSALYLGSVTVAWLLGHRYLTATDMTIAPLRRLSHLLLVTIGARWIFLIVMLAAMAIVSRSGGSGPTALDQLFDDWLLVSIRIGVGLMLPTIFAYMAWDCVRLRSTQSATGILFFMSIFVIIGELSSQQLAARFGFPL